MSSNQTDTKTRILKSTAQLLAKSRGKGVRMTDIAKLAKVSRQALYLHFATRAELFVETTYYIDRLKGNEERLAKSRAAKSGVDRLDAFIEAWGGYIPEIYPIAHALIGMMNTDEEAALAWNKRMQDMKKGCEAAILALENDKQLNQQYSIDQATELLWTMLSVGNWEQLTKQTGWSQVQYINQMKSAAYRLFAK